MPSAPTGMITLKKSSDTNRFKGARLGCSIIFIAAGLAFSLAPKQVGARDYRQEIARARHEAFSNATLAIKRLDLGEGRWGTNHFSALVRNRTRQPVTIALDLRADPGIWWRKWQDQFYFTLRPREKKSIEAEYQFSRMSAEAFLRVRFGLARTSSRGRPEMGEPFFERRYDLGLGNPSVDFELARLFLERKTTHFDIYYYPHSLAAQEIEAIARARESAYQNISTMLEVKNPETIRLFLFPDAGTKLKETGHQGAGFASGRLMVEIYNATTKLDPYHELTHVLAGQLGDPPALFNEGLAVYVAELNGADALKDLGSPGKKADEAVAAHRQAGQYLPLDELFALTDIGPEASSPTVSYPEAASFVKYLIQNYGLENFRQTYRSLAGADDPETIAKNKQVFKKIYGKLPGELEPSWLASLPSTSP